MVKVKTELNFERHCRLPLMSMVFFADLAKVLSSFSNPLWCPLCSRLFPWSHVNAALLRNTQIPLCRFSTCTNDNKLLISDSMNWCSDLSIIKCNNINNCYYVHVTAKRTTNLWWNETSRKRFDTNRLLQLSVQKERTNLKWENKSRCDSVRERLLLFECETFNWQHGEMFLLITTMIQCKHNTAACDGTSQNCEMEKKITNHSYILLSRTQDSKIGYFPS